MKYSKVIIKAIMVLLVSGVSVFATEKSSWLSCCKPFASCWPTNKVQTLSVGAAGPQQAGGAGMNNAGIAHSAHNAVPLQGNGAGMPAGAHQGGAAVALAPHIHISSPESTPPGVATGRMRSQASAARENNGAGGVIITGATFNGPVAIYNGSPSDKGPRRVLSEYEQHSREQQEQALSFANIQPESAPNSFAALQERLNRLTREITVLELMKEEHLKRSEQRGDDKKRMISQQISNYQGRNMLKKLQHAEQLVLLVRSI